MKIGVIAELLRLPLRASLAEAARWGAQGVQLHAMHADHDLLAFGPKRLADLRSWCDDHGLVVSALCGDLPGHGFRRPAENPAKIEKEKRIIDLLPALGCRIVSMHIGVIPSDPRHPEYAPMRDALAELGEHAAAQGCALAIETGPETAEVLRDFILATGGRGVGVNFDPANLVMVHNADPVAAVRTLRGLILHTHVKDGIHHQACDPEKVYGAFAEGGFEKLVAETGALFTEVPPGKGRVRWPEYLSALREIGYDGFLTIEREVGDDPARDIASAITFLRGLLA